MIDNKVSLATRLEKYDSGKDGRTDDGEDKVLFAFFGEEVVSASPNSQELQRCSIRILKSQ